VFASSKHVDELDIVKMIMRGNIVYDNLNKIPYYNKNYAWDYSPIGSESCGSYPACESGQVDGCPWTCRYGKASQDYIIDGQGVYVTRNEDTYLHGRMELSGNVAYRNGINGVVFHRTNRGVVKDNIVFENGIVPKDGHPEPVHEDWHACCPGKGRQPYSGLILNEAEDVEVFNNAVAARYEDDYAFKMQMDGGAAEYQVTGGDNQVCAGMGSLDPANVVSTPGACTDEKTTYMENNGHSCESWDWGLENYCNKNDEWVNTRYCELSCTMRGYGYDTTSCCALEAWAHYVSM